MNAQKKQEELQRLFSEDEWKTFRWIERGVRTFLALLLGGSVWALLGGEGIWQGAGIVTGALALLGVLHLRNLLLWGSGLRDQPDERATEKRDEQ